MLLAALLLAHFQQKWVPVLRPEIRQIKLAAPPIDGDLPPAPGFADPAPPQFRQPPRDPPIDGDTAQAIVIRLVELHALDSAADAADPAKLANAVRAYQAAAGLKTTGLIDKLTLAALGL